MSSKPVFISVNDSFGATLDFPLGTPEAMLAVPAFPVASSRRHSAAVAAAAAQCDLLAAKANKTTRIFAAVTLSALAAMILFICLR